MMYGDTVVKLVHAQTILLEDDLDKLKERSGEHTTKDAISKAVDHYLDCKDVKLKEVKGKDNANFRTTN